jgi:hypothetical protein
MMIQGAVLIKVLKWRERTGKKPSVKLRVWYPWRRRTLNDFPT